MVISDNNRRDGVEKHASERDRVDLSKRVQITGLPWMQEPVRVDDSWVPVEVPAREIPPVSVIVHTTPGSFRPPTSPSLKTQSMTKSVQSRDGSAHSRGARTLPDLSPNPRTSLERSSRSRGVRTPSEMSPNPKPPIPLHVRISNSEVLAQQQSHHRVRGPSKERSSRELTVLPPTTRGRSNGASQSVPEKRERSISQSRSIGGSSHASHRSVNDQNTNPNSAHRGRSRPPVTAKNKREGGVTRERSLSSSSMEGRNRIAHSRSASLTRVTNTPQAPPSPTVRSAKSPSSRSKAAAHQVSRNPQENRHRQGSSHNRSLSEEDQDANIGRDISFGINGMTASVCSTDSKRSKLLVRKLVGEQQQKGGKKVDDEQIRSRVLLAATVYHNTATGLWITTINTNQKGVARDPKVANKYLKAFSFPSEQEARESAIANAPPKMIPFGEAQQCFLCKSPFTVFKRASHCKNCGVCICKDCSVQWTSKNIPETYNLKNEVVVRVCRSCHAISKAFRKSLTQGDYRGALAIYGTGNVNLRTPFPIEGKKDEILWPVHCAAEGGNINILRWLVDIHFCPITTIPSGNRKARRGSPESLILTSTGRHVLGISITNLKVDIMQYLVVDKGISIYESKELVPSLRALEATLIALPRVTDRREPVDEAAEPKWDNGSFDDMSIPSTIGVETSKHGPHDDAGTIGSKTSKSSDFCIICYDRKIDCVATPCGHQICCLQCSSNLTSCPVCNHKGDFIRIFRP